jgi:hypothetical protein
MRHLPLALVLILTAFLSACASTPSSRVADHRAEFDGYPPDVRVKILEGNVDLGFTPRMVRLALGEPTRVFNRQSEAGTSEIWSYHSNSPRFSFGVGFGSYGRHSGTSVGVGTSTGGYDPEERMRVEFRDGKVTAVDYVKR